MKTLKLSHRNSQAVLFVFAFVLLVSVCFIHIAIRKKIPVLESVKSSSPEYIGTTIDPRVLRRLLGLRLLASDLLWIDTLIKADIAHEPMPFTSFYRSFRTVVTLDPDNVYAYYIAGLYLSVIKDDIKGATAIMREGIKHLETHEYVWDDAWRLPYMYGYNLIFEENEVDEGSHWILKAAEMPLAPKYVKSLATHVSTEAGRLEVASKILSELYRRFESGEEKKRIEEKMLKIALRQELVDLNEKFQTFLQTTGAFAHSRSKQFQLFMRSIGHTKKDMLGRPLMIDSSGKIVTAHP